jgi:hypothetical protein
MQAKQGLHKVLDLSAPAMHQTRRESLAANVMAALTGRSLVVTHLGRSMPSASSMTRVSYSELSTFATHSTNYATKSSTFIQVLKCVFSWGSLRYCPQISLINERLDLVGELQSLAPIFLRVSRRAMRTISVYFNCHRLDLHHDWFQLDLGATDGTCAQ